MKETKNYNNQLLIALSIAAGLLVLGQVAILLLFGGGGVEAAIVADKKADVVQVYHAMDVKSASFSQVEVDMTLETRDKAHAEEIVIALCNAGYFVELR